MGVSPAETKATHISTAENTISVRDMFVLFHRNNMLVEINTANQHLRSIGTLSLTQHYTLRSDGTPALRFYLELLPTYCSDGTFFFQVK